MRTPPSIPGVLGARQVGFEGEGADESSPEQSRGLRQGPWLVPAEGLVVGPQGRGSCPRTPASLCQC